MDTTEDVAPAHAFLTAQPLADASAVTPIMNGLTGLLARFGLTTSPPGVPPFVNKFDVSTFILEGTRHLKEEGLLQTSAAPISTVVPAPIIVVRADEVVYGKTKFFLDPTESHAVGHKPKIYGTSTDAMTASMKALGYIETAVSFLGDDLSLLPPAVSAGGVPDDADEDAAPQAPVNLSLAPKFDRVAVTAEQNVAQLVVNEFENFAVSDGTTYSPLHLYTKAARAHHWKSKTAVQQAFSERCKAYIYIRKYSGGTPAAGITLGLSDMCTAAMKETEDERDALTKKAKLGYWHNAACGAFGAGGDLA
jgi:hypothetical protein